MSSPAPAFEYTDDPSAFAAESAAHARRWLAAERITCALIRAAHAEPAEQRQPTRETHAEHLRLVQHFAEWVRDARVARVRLGLPVSPFPSAGMVRVMLSRGVLPHEVEVSV